VTSKPGGSHHAPQAPFAVGNKAYERDRKRAEIPIYSFEKHARVDKTTAIYSPHVLVVEGIFALHDPRVLELLDMKVRRPTGHRV
jgi:pantothenate kinase